jgi:vacuolar-type H+-ATPase subunit I/STV1
LPKPKPSVIKPQDREDKLESVAFLCYSIGLALLLISWALASEWIFGIGALLLACGAIAVLALGLNNITRAYVGYMTIFTLLGAIYMLVRFGWLDDLISAWKH